MPNAQEGQKGRFETFGGKAWMEGSRGWRKKPETSPRNINGK
jgi:hypothetical protein